MYESIIDTLVTCNGVKCPHSKWPPTNFFQPTFFVISPFHPTHTLKMKVNETTGKLNSLCIIFYSDH